MDTKNFVNSLMDHQKQRLPEAKTLEETKGRISDEGPVLSDEALDAVVGGWGMMWRYCSIHDIESDINGVCPLCKAEEESILSHDPSDTYRVL